MAIRKHPLTPFIALTAAAGLLAACGGEANPDAAAEAVTPSTTAAALEDSAAQPLFHRQPMDLDEPDARDADGAARSAQADPTVLTVPNDLRGLSTQGLTDDRVQAWRAAGDGRARALAATPAATTAPAPVVYTPAQIRAAYRLPVAPVSAAGLSAAAAAALGAGQTIYVVNAYHHPNALADLNAFSAKFGLPGCTAVAAPAAVAVLPAPPAACTFSVVYAATGGTITTKVPAYNAGWATEIALDLQWAHAIAPLARLVLVEGADNARGLQDAIALAGKLGPGIVTMSFGGTENSSVLATAPLFAAAGVSYVAATGDSGVAANWPAVMPAVLAVGGTSLRSSATARTETTWSLTGGGLSAVVPTPAYQQALKVPGLSTAPRTRAVADVAFNADPATGQYFAFTPPGSTTRWYAGGGTSIAAPQWAGLLAVANAQRAALRRAPLGALHAGLYAGFVPASTAWMQAFNDVTVGANGSCATCRSAAGYDTPTGLGTPKADALLPALVAR